MSHFVINAILFTTRLVLPDKLATEVAVSTLSYVCLLCVCFLFARFHFSNSFQTFSEKFKYVNFLFQPLITLNLMGNVPER